MEITPELITQYGLMSKISTGNTYLDLVFCLLVPIALRHLLPLLKYLQQFLPSKAVTKSFSRCIEFTQRSGYYWYDSDKQPPNSILQRAVLNLINRQVKILRELPDADVSIKKKPASHIDRDADGAGRGEDDGASSSCSSNVENDNSGSKEDAYTFNLVPPTGQWVDLKNGLHFRLEKEVMDDKQRSTKVRYKLKSDARDGNKLIAAFIQEALEIYRKEQSAQMDPARYLYMPVLSGFREPAASDGESSSKPSAVYKRYKLSEEKTFASFFHPDKEAILKLVDQFLSKNGKFAIPGYPQKLGFLLYGPPGTGKTSLIKALAQHTKRSIISVPLSKISTNQELMDIVFDNKLQIQNSSDSAISLPFEKTIFVMEDVDAASTVVQRRSSQSGFAPSALEPSAATATALAEQISAAKLHVLSATADASSRTPRSRDSSNSKDDGTGSDDQDTDGEAEETDASGKERQAAAVVPAAAASSSLAAAARFAGYDVSSGWGTSGVAIGPSLPYAAFGRGLFKGDDELNLAGLLNVLDGVVDTPNRIIIMTTNHPEKLDPALIRPGRINKKVYMGRLKVAEALCMMRHYFGPLPAADEAAMRAVFVDERLSPADLESMCAEYDTPEEMVRGLAGRLAGGEEGFKACL